jgi:hypothetical protein
MFRGTGEIASAENFQGRQGRSVRDHGRAFPVLNDADVGIEHGGRAIHAQAVEKRGSRMRRRNTRHEQPGIRRIEMDHAAYERIARSREAQFGLPPQRHRRVMQESVTARRVVDVQGLG